MLSQAAGVEPAWMQNPLDFESDVSTNSTIAAIFIISDMTCPATHPSRNQNPLTILRKEYDHAILLLDRIKIFKYYCRQY